VSRDRNRERHERQQHEQAMEGRRKKTSPEQGEKIGPDATGEPGFTNFGRLKDYQIDLVNMLKNDPRFAEKIFHGDFTVTGRIRPRSDDRGDFYDAFRYMSGKETDAYYREMQHKQQKLEEGDLESRHHVPPEDRFLKFVARYGERRALDHILELLLEQEDLENFMDVLEPTAEHDSRRTDPYMRRRDERY
jgi:hypothetical protein